MKERSQSSSAPKILFVLSGLGAGGAERVASSMLNFWAGENRQIGLLTLANLDPDHYSVDSRVTRLKLDVIWPSRNLWEGVVSNYRRLQMIRSSVTEYDPDIVISFIDRTNVLVLGALLGTGIPVIVSERVDPRFGEIDRVRRIARRCLYPSASALVVQTQAVASWARAVVKSKSIAVIANPVDPLPSPLKYSERPLSLLAVGRLTHQKGFDLLIRAFATSRMRDAGWELNILGEGPDRALLEALIEDLGLQNQVQLRGVVTHPWQWMDQARVFVLPSRFEGFPNALLEAMAMGCACVATDCQSGPSEIIDGSANGLLVRSEDLAALASTLDELESDSNQCASLSVGAQNVRERYATEKILSEWNLLIGRILRAQKK